MQNNFGTSSHLTPSSRTVREMCDEKLLHFCFMSKQVFMFSLQAAKIGLETPHPILSTIFFYYIILMKEVSAG